MTNKIFYWDGNVYTLGELLTANSNHPDICRWLLDAVPNDQRNFNMGSLADGILCLADPEPVVHAQYRTVRFEFIHAGQMTRVVALQTWIGLGWVVVTTRDATYPLR